MERDYRLKGQAILELAIFGAILIMLLGILLNYGLRYGYQQQAMQFAFRKALGSATGNSLTPISHLVVRDRHIPNPNHPFALGSVIPFYSSASIIRSNKLDETPDYTEDLPKMSIDVEHKSIDAGHQNNEFTTAGFIYNAGEELKKCKRRYEEVYGANNFWRINRESGDVLDWETGDLLVKRTSIKTNEPPFNKFLQWLHDNLPAKHRDPQEDEKEKPLFMVEIVDYSNGEISDYDSAVRQCRLIVDDDVCYKSCLRGGSDDCEDVCSEKQHIPEPWYCENGVETDSGQDIWAFPKLKELFFPQRSREEAYKGEKAPTWSMGLQADSVQTVIVNNQLDKTETFSNITTTDNFDWNITTKRKIFYKKEDQTRGELDVQTEVLPQKKSRTWETPW